MALKITPSNNPEQESKQFGKISIICGILSLFVWIFGIAALSAGVRGAILSNRVGDKKHLAFSTIGIVLGSISLIYYYASK